MPFPSMLDSVILGIAFLFVATLYSSVGHGGASGYLAVMALAGLTPSVMRPTALSLNVVVTVVGTILYWKAGCIRWRMLLLFIIPSAPAAFIGAMIDLPGWTYRRVVGLVLLYAAWKTLGWGLRGVSTPHSPEIPMIPAATAGCGIGLLSGLTGVGGGIFLTPLLVLTGWAGTRQAAGISSAFILLNSIAGILGLGVSGTDLPWPLPGWMAAVCGGAFIGSQLGANTLSPVLQTRLLALVLAIAGLKMIVF